MKRFESSALHSGQPARQLLEQIGYRAMNVDNRITLSLIFPANADSLVARANSHLTNSTPQDFQIRFPLRDRVRRSLIKLADDVVHHYEHQIPQLTVYLSDDDFVSHCFFSRFPQVHIRSFEPSFKPDEADFLTRSMASLTDYAHARIYAGDYRAAYKTLISIQQSDRSDSINYMLGLCTNFFGRTEESEIHFRNLLTSSKPLARIQASYVLSMLYLRMHEQKRRDLLVAEDLLQTAHATLLAHPDVDDSIFHRVFNRNGYALCLFRRGKVEEALAMLETGIEALKADSAGSRALHRSVLVYNAIQCLRTLGRFQECEKKCEELLDLDPKMPEYLLEQSRIYIDQKKFESALQSINRAVRLDAFIPEAHALKGYCFLELGRLEEASESYRRANNLDSTNVTHMLDLAYCLSELNQKAELVSLLSEIESLAMTDEERQSVWALREEVSA